MEGSAIRKKGANNTETAIGKKQELTGRGF